MEQVAGDKTDTRDGTGFCICNRLLHMRQDVKYGTGYCKCGSLLEIGDTVY